jgi:hypothetical protein
MSTTDKRKSNFKILIPIVLLVIISIVVYMFLTQKQEVDEENDSPIQTQQERISEIKEDLRVLIPEQYEVIESEYEEPSEENDGCVTLYQMYPKEYSEIEKEYLDKASLIYCEHINKALLKGQVEEVRYNQTDEKWVRIQLDSEELLDVKQYGDNLVSIVELGGSHASSIYYIVSVEGSDELVILSVPRFHRIRCETYDENGVETMKEDCIEFITSMGMRADSSESVPDEIYQNYYYDLLEILKDI